MLLRTLVVLLTCFVIVRGAAPTTEQERDQVRVAALRFMMTKHAEFGKEREHYSLYVLRDVGYVKHFASFQPAVVPFEEGRYSASSGRATDTKTGRPVKIWSIRGEKIESEKATVGIKWYSASLAAGSHTVFLVKKDGVWIAEREQMGAVSKNEPNKAPEPTPLLVTIRACARLAPSSVVAHL